MRHPYSAHVDLPNPKDIQPTPQYAKLLLKSLHFCLLDHVSRFSMVETGRVLIHIEESACTYCELSCTRRFLCKFKIYLSQFSIGGYILYAKRKRQISMWLGASQTLRREELRPVVQNTVSSQLIPRPRGQISVISIFRSLYVYLVVLCRWTILDSTSNTAVPLGFHSCFSSQSHFATYSQSVCLGVEPRLGLFSRY